MANGYWDTVIDLCMIKSQKISTQFVFYKCVWFVLKVLATPFQIEHGKQRSMYQLTSKISWHNDYRAILISTLWGQHGAHLGPTGPRWAPCWPHELCYLGKTNWHVDGLVQDCSNFSALAMELLQSCTKPSMYCFLFWGVGGWGWGGILALFTHVCEKILIRRAIKNK